jgi:hypothetical protein
MKSLTRILLLAALALVALSLVPPAHAARKMEVMLQDDGILVFPNDYYDREMAFRQARALGVSTLRINVQWWKVMPEPQATAATKPSAINYQWGVWDSAIARARQYGMQVQLALVGDPPTWACGNKRPPFACDGYKPDVGEFRAFAQSAAAHFGGAVKRYSIWNEPNWYTWISPHKQSPLLYRKLYQAGYKGVKRGNPKAKVFMGELAPAKRPGLSMAPLEFIRKMVCVNKRLKRTNNANRKCGKRPLKLDAFAHHPYRFETRPKAKPEFKDEVTIATLDRLNALLAKLKKKGLLKKKGKIPVYLTEHGYMVTGNPDVPPRRRIPESKRKRWIVQSFKIAQRNRRVKGMLYYNLVSPPLGSPSSYFDLGLIQTNGTARASYLALQNWVQAAIRDGKVKRPPPCSGVSC